MLKTKRMTKLRVLVLRSSAEALIRSLHESGLMQIDDTKMEGLDSGKPLKSFEDASVLLLKLRSALSIMEGSVGKNAPRVSPDKEIDVKSALIQARSLDMEERLRSLSNESATLGERMKELESGSQTTRKISHFSNVDFSKLETRKLTYRIGETNNPAGLRQRLSKFEDLEVISRPPSPIMLIIFDRKNEPGVESAISETGFNALELPSGTTTPSDTVKRNSAEMDSISPKLESIRREIKMISEKNISYVRSLIAALETEAERGEIASRFSSSKSVYVIDGWALGENFSQLNQLCDKFGGKVQLEEMKYSHHEKPPIVLDNPRIAEPFEFLTRGYSLPNYFEIDPTMAYIIALPILYGMILGDVIYGLISFVIAYLIFRKFQNGKTMRPVSLIWMYSAIPTVIIGVLYDEWGGMSHYHLAEFIGKWTGIHLLAAPLYTGFSRMENVMGLIAITCLVGMLHLAIGFIFGAINEWNHNKKHSIAKIAWLGVEIGGLLVLLALVGMLDKAFINAGLVLLAISVVILALTEGLLGIIELPGLAGNILSYSRIATIGIVGVVIAEMLNDLLIPTPDKGLAVIILIPIFIALHVSNAFLAMFEAIIQGGRLNIVEFKSKFLHGGGAEYIPFALRKR